MKKQMLIIALLGVTVLGFVGCGGSEEVKSNNPNKQETTSEKDSKEEENSISLEESNKKIREEAVKADFVKINGEEMNGKAVFVTGKVSNLELDETIPRFTLTSEENNGYGIYTMVLFDDDAKDRIKDGETITAYGYVIARDSSGIPQITANIIEN